MHKWPTQEPGGSLVWTSAALPGSDWVLCSSTPGGKVPGSLPLVLRGELKFNISASGTKETIPSPNHVDMPSGKCALLGLVQGTVTSRESRGSSNSNSPLTLCSQGRWSLPLLSTPLHAHLPWGPATAPRRAVLPGWKFSSSIKSAIVCVQGKRRGAWDFPGLTQSWGTEIQT